MTTYRDGQENGHPDGHTDEREVISQFSEFKIDRYIGADGKDKIGTGCIGLVADPCRAKTENDTDKNRACAARELRVWNSIADAAGKRVRAGGFKEVTKALTESEKSWAAQRDILCPVFDKVEPGSLPGDAAYCRMQTTANRALLLRRLGDAVNER